MERNNGSLPLAFPCTGIRKDRRFPNPQNCRRALARIASRNCSGRFPSLLPSYDSRIYPTNRCPCNDIDLYLFLGKGLENTATKSTQRTATLKYQYIFYCPTLTEEEDDILFWKPSFLVFTISSSTLGKMPKFHYIHSITLIVSHTIIPHDDYESIVLGLLQGFIAPFLSNLPSFSTCRDSFGLTIRIVFIVF